MNGEPEIISESLDAHPIRIARDAQGNFVLQIQTINTLIVKNIKETDIVEWSTFGTDVAVNGKIIGQPKQRMPVNDNWRESFNREMYVDKSGTLRYKDNHEKVMGN